ncbi:MAG TPA: cytochrome c oxidase assembly protein [Acidimicrobiia bacterium]
MPEINWWCVALDKPWSWQWIAYPGIWVASIAPMVVYTVAVRRHGSVDWRKARFFYAGMIVFWIASDWPLGTLGAGYMASAHMVQFLLYTLGAAPLLMLGTPEWMARGILDRLRLTKAIEWLGGNYLVCALLYNGILMATHAPGTVEVLRRNQLGSAFMDVVWVLAGIVLWLPVISPLGRRVAAPWGRMAYLFVATAVIAIVPASFLTFATTPVYAIYELAPRVTSLSAREDQQLAGIIMKLATIPVVWTTIAVMWFRWARHEEQAEEKAEVTA